MQYSWNTFHAWGIHHFASACKKLKWSHESFVGVNIRVSGRKNHEYVSFLLAIYI